MSISTILKARRKELGLTLGQVADKVGVAEATVQKWENGSIKSIRRERISVLADVLQVPPEVLAGQEVPLGSPQDPLPTGFEPLPEMGQVPLIGTIASGSPVLAGQNIRKYICVPAAWHSDFALRFKGDSMCKTLKDGDIVCVSKQAQIRPGDLVAVRVGGEVTLRRFHQRGNVITLASDNASICLPLVYVDQSIEEIDIEGKAVGLCRGL